MHTGTIENVPTSSLSWRQEHHDHAQAWLHILLVFYWFFSAGFFILLPSMTRLLVYYYYYYFYFYCPTWLIAGGKSQPFPSANMYLSGHTWPISRSHLKKKKFISSVGKGRMYCSFGVLYGNNNNSSNSVYLKKKKKKKNQKNQKNQNFFKKKRVETAPSTMLLLGIFQNGTEYQRGTNRDLFCFSY